MGQEERRKANIESFCFPSVFLSSILDFLCMCFITVLQTDRDHMFKYAFKYAFERIQIYHCPKLISVLRQVSCAYWIFFLFCNAISQRERNSWYRISLVEDSTLLALKEEKPQGWDTSSVM